MPEEPDSIVNLDRRSLKEELEATLKKKSVPMTPQGIAVGEVTIAAARRAAPLRAAAGERTDIRIAFVTSDTDVLIPGTSIQQHYADLAQFVGEVHVLVLKSGRGEPVVERPMKNVWVYQIPGRHSLQQMIRAWQTARRHLRFNKVVQPDVLVATDPFTAGLATWVLATFLRRPWQLHLAENIFSVEWIARRAGNGRRHRLAKFVAGRARSVRAVTAQALAGVAPHTRRGTDNAVLPHLYNLTAYQVDQPINLRDQYPQYSLLILAEGVYSADSPLHDTFAALHQLLHNPRVGLLVRGSGRAKSLFTQKVSLLGIAPQVVFLDPGADPIPIYQSADIFIETGTDSDADERVLHAIAAGTAVVSYRNDFRDSLMVDGQTGFMIEPGDSYTLGQQVRTLINNSSLRQQFAMLGRRTAQEQLHEDVHTYYQAYRDSIAGAIGVLPAPEATDPASLSPEPESESVPDVAPESEPDAASAASEAAPTQPVEPAPVSLATKE